jgi:hypothetical protein
MGKAVHQGLGGQWAARGLGLRLAARRRLANSLRRVMWDSPRVLVITAAVFGLLACSASAEPPGVYALKRPTHAHCRPHYLRWQEVHRHFLIARCVLSAPPYGGPWDSAHEPPTITNPGVTQHV